jgi:uncharacterized protein (DUF3084 family)
LLVVEFPGVLLMIALVLISGLVAYIGDIVGRRMGRKRVSLFGLRPRHTAIVFSVAAGMVITIMTLAVAMLVSRDVKDGFLKVVEMRQRQAELSQQLAKSGESMGELERTRDRTQAELDKEREELRAATADLQTTKKELATADAALTRTEAARQRAETATKSAEGAARRSFAVQVKLQRLKDELQRDVENLRTQVAGGITMERATPVLFGAGQPLDWQLIDGARPVTAVRQDLDAFVAGLDAQARRAGAQPLPGEKEAVIIRKPIRDPDTQGVAWFGEGQVLSAVAERVHEDNTGVIVRAFSVFNTHPGEPVRVDFELFRNRLVFRRGEALAQTVMDGRQSEPTLMGQLLALLRQEVNAKARSNNIMPRPATAASEAIGTTQETVGNITIEKLFAAVERLRAIGGMARLSAVASTDTWTIGPLEVDLLITPAS